MLLGLLALLLGLAAVVVVRTLMFTARIEPLPPAETVAVDREAAAERLAGAIRIPTVTRTRAPHFDPATFEAFHQYLREQFPLAHTRLSTETINGTSLLFTWRGQSSSELLSSTPCSSNEPPGPGRRWFAPRRSAGGLGGIANLRSIVPSAGV